MVLSEPDRDRLTAFFRRTLELHASGAVTTDSALEYFMLLVDALAAETPEALRSAMSSLEDAWQTDA